MTSSIWSRSGEPGFDKNDPEFVRRYFPDAELDGPGRRHDALYDAQASAAELGYYRAHLARR